MPGDRCRSRWFHRQRTGVVGSGCRHHMAVGGSGEEEEHSLGCWHRSVGGAVAGEEEGAAVRQPARRGCDNSRRALLGREEIVGQRSYPVTSTSAVDSIMSGACLLLERETYTDEERVALGAKDVQESGDE
ncbi:hypothetical protein GW17_00026902 [Ensete ventricosum]|nr:hypothetical protein GW17_00026902 [Ensete ventricosum]